MFDDPIWTVLVLSADDAYVLALEFDRNPIVDDEAAFDLYPLYVESRTGHENST